jgi:hypothetical protein
MYFTASLARVIQRLLDALEIAFFDNILLSEANICVIDHAVVVTILLT